MTPSGPAEGLSGDILERLMAQRKQFLSFLTKRVGSESVAEDILQAAFVRGYEKGGQIRDQDSAVAWFYRMLRNAVIDHYRHRDSSERALGELAREMETKEQAPTEVFDEVCRCVAALAETLKPEYRQALQTIDIEEGRLADLAAQVGITTDNAAARIHRARRALRERVAATCGMCAQHGCLNCSCKSTSQC
jgi:RNA polymerase sigma-70 factor (ECF subfamily)